MKYEIMLGILFTLLTRRKATAAELAEKFSCSTRSVYRYIDEMCVAGVPIDNVQGAGGGIYISDCYKLPKGLFTKAEYERTLEALLAFREQISDDTVQDAIDKLTAKRKEEKFDKAISGNILVDNGTWGDETKFNEKLTLIETAIDERELLDITYVDRGGEETKRSVKPLLLVYKQNIWYLYAYCTLRNDFRLFKIGRMRSILHTGVVFEKVEFSRGDVPLSFWKENTIDARFEISPEALPFAEEWLGVENIKKESDGRLIAEATLPDDESLAGKILSAGAGFKVIYPLSLRARVQAEVQKLLEIYG